MYIDKMLSMTNIEKVFLIILTPPPPHGPAPKNELEATDPPQQSYSALKL